MVHLQQPGPDSGVFDTEEVRPRDKPSKSTSRIIGLPRVHGVPYYKEPPNLAAGFRSLHLSHETPVRANLVADRITNSQFRITIETWGGSTLYGAAATWMEHKANAKDCLFGQFDTNDVVAPARKTANGKRAPPPQETSKVIVFPRPFNGEPEIICWLNRIDMANGENRSWRIRAYASNVSANGFTAHVDTWADSVLNGAAMCWIAFPKNKAHVASGTFGTGDVRNWSNPKPNNSAHARFKLGTFKKPPTVLVGLNMLDMAGNADLRINLGTDKVTSEGFTWHLDTWDDSTLYAAGASWIALGFV